MQALGLIERVEPYRHAVGVCYRCKTVVEPLISLQWYVNVKPLAEVAIKAVRGRRIKLHPRPWIKTYYNWMENIRPWTISRQLWWGHRIPVWYCDADGSVHVSRTDLTECPKCGGLLRQDPDVLDTWFSSGLWPFSTLGWPEETPDLKTFYPTDVLITGPDILTFWVSRMIMLGMHFMDDVPFRDVYLHAIVRDAEGQKMSKSKGNVADPVVVMEKFGTDAFRFTLAALAGLGRDIRISEERIEGYRNFANKIWNASRLVLTNLDGYDPALARKGKPSIADRWITSRLHAATAAVRKALDTFRFNDAAMAVYQFLWNEFCDWYLEIAKRSLYRTDDPIGRAVTQRTLVETLEATLRLLHPFMPFISEDIWQRLPHEGESIPGSARSIVVAPFPKAGRKGRDAAAEREMAYVIDVVSAIRTARSESRISPAAEVEVTVRPSAEAAELLVAATPLMGALAKARVTVRPDAQRPAQSAHVVASGIDVFVHLEGVVDLAAERARLGKEIERARKEIAFLEGKLGRPDFVERAPAEVVTRERARLEEQQQILAKLGSSLAALQ
jgi:valyl-tRNA synthetase